MNSLSLKLLVAWFGIVAMNFAAFSNCSAESLNIGKLPANRTVKIKYVVKVNENFPRTANTISNGVIISSSDGGTIILPALTETVYYTPNTPVVVPLPNEGVTRDPTPTLGGASDPNTTIEIFDGDSAIGTTTTDEAGNWTFIPAQPLSYGIHTFKIRAVNGTSQSSEFSGTFQIKIDCPAGVFGVTCSNTCPGGTGSSACGGHGTCSDGLEGSGACTCDSGHFDFACSQNSSVCNINISDGVYNDSEWGGVKAILNVNNDVRSNPYYWKTNKWVTKPQQSFRFITDPKAWFAISSAKSCLGYQNGTQVMYLMLQSQFPLASYYDSSAGNNYRFGFGSNSKAAVPAHQFNNVIWKLMPSAGGALYYLVLTLEYNQGDTFSSSAFRSLKLYKESSSDIFSTSNFSKESFDPGSDSFAIDLGNIVNSLVPNISQDKDKLPAIETGVDLLKLFSATGWNSSTPLMTQVMTQALKVKGDGSVVVKEIDRSGTQLLSDLNTEPALGAPSLSLKQSGLGRVTLRCDIPEGVSVSKYFYRVVKYSSNEPEYYTSKSKTVVAKVKRRSAYKAVCYYQTKDGQRSDSSVERGFRVKGNT